MTPNVRRTRRQFGWVFIPTMLWTGLTLGAIYLIWTTPNVVDRVIPSLLAGATLLLVWPWVFVTLQVYRNSVKISRMHLH